MFETHRPFPWLFVFSSIYHFYTIKKARVEGQLKKVGDWVIALILIQLLVGVGLYYLDMPRVLQITHLVSFTVFMCVQFLMLLMLGLKDKTQEMEFKAVRATHS